MRYGGYGVKRLPIPIDVKLTQPILIRPLRMLYADKEMPDKEQRAAVAPRTKKSETPINTSGNEHYHA